MRFRGRYNRQEFGKKLLATTLLGDKIPCSPAVSSSPRTTRPTSGSPRTTAPASKQLCRYLLRFSLGRDRLRLRGDGRVLVGSGSSRRLRIT